MTALAHGIQCGTMATHIMMYRFRLADGREEEWPGLRVKQLVDAAYGRDDDRGGLWPVSLGDDRFVPAEWAKRVIPYGMSVSAYLTEALRQDGSRFEARCADLVRYLCHYVTQFGETTIVMATWAVGSSSPQALHVTVTPVNARTLKASITDAHGGVWEHEDERAEELSCWLEARLGAYISTVWPPIPRDMRRDPVLLQGPTCVFRTRSPVPRLACAWCTRSAECIRISSASTA